MQRFVSSIALVSLITINVLAEESVQFNRDIRPLISNMCFQCHGPDENTREAGLRLDVADGAYAELGSGLRAIVPGSPEESAILDRITSDDPSEMMPPPTMGVRMDDDEVARVRQWIAEGAVYDSHWSFKSIERPELPSVSNAGWPRNPIDHFVLARLDSEGLSPSQEADRYTLVRRLYLDLTGLPPTPDQADAFVNDTSGVAYEKLVDELLESPHYGERFARMWLDLARYADSKGYEKDDMRTIWRYRDWVIDAFNRDLPFDKFTEEQLAGDLLPDPTTNQLIATAFHRNTMTNDEGGTDDEEFRNAAIVDRVNTTMEVWMGMTMACAQCHTHKYDPILQSEYYEVFDFFNQSADSDRVDEAPTIKTPTATQERELALLAKAEAHAEASLMSMAQALADERAAWEEDMAAKAREAIVLGPWYSTAMVTGDNHERLHKDVLEFEKAHPPVLEGEGALFTKNDTLKDGEALNLPEDLAAHGFYRAIHAHANIDVTLRLGSNDTLKVWLNGEVVHDNYIGRTLTPNEDKVDITLKPGRNDLLIKVVNMGSAAGFHFGSMRTPFSLELTTALTTDAKHRTPEQIAILDKAFVETSESLAPYREKLNNIRSERDAIAKSIPTTPIMQELPEAERRATHIQERGSFLSPGDQVSADVPEVFHEWNEDWPKNRLGFAKWLTTSENPLTARVIANRYWEEFFGQGIVATSEDFGIQGELPTHPELLDWLASEFMANDWSMKDLCRTIVTSATYRQASSVDEEIVARDPYNRLYARGPRIRLSAEAIRDQALAVSGLLSDTMFGPSVMPYQPDGVWQVVYSGRQWETSEGDNKYRRGIYTFWRRTAPYPSMMAFDAPSREFCELSRMRTNTPLQALVTLNDPVYIEAAQALARLTLQQPAASDSDRIAFAFRRVLVRPPTNEETEMMVTLLNDARADYANDLAAAEKMATDPIGPISPGLDVADVAAYTIVGNVLLNLDETVMKL